MTLKNTQQGAITTTASVAILLFVIGVGVYVYFASGDESEIEIVRAERVTLQQEVGVTGRVRPIENVGLGFEIGGRVADVFVDVGDVVFRGQTLLRLESGDAAAQLAQARAQAKAERAVLNTLLRGTRPEEIEIQKITLANAEAALLEEKRNVINKIEEVYIDADDAIHNDISQLFSNPNSAYPTLAFSISNTALKFQVEGGMATAKDILATWKVSLDGLSLLDDPEPYRKEAEENLIALKDFFSTAALAVNELQASASISQTIIDGYKADVSSARNAINVGIAGLIAAQEAYVAAESLVSLEESQLELLIAGSTPEDILAQEARLEETEANVLRFEADFAKRQIRSPLRGIVTSVDVSEGEIVAAGTQAVSIIAESGFEIVVNVLEADIAYLDVGDPATLTLDAYGEDLIFSAQVVEIDPAETIIDGVSTYTTTLAFEDDDARIRSGMTADIDIVTEVREDVIAIPQRAVIFQDGRKIVRVLEDGEVVEHIVETGISSTDGRIEIRSGITEGAEVVTSNSR